MTALAVSIPIALSVIFGAAAVYGGLGQSAASFMTSKILPFLTSLVGPFPAWSVILMGFTAVGSPLIFSLSLCCLKHKERNVPKENTLTETGSKEINQVENDASIRQSLPKYVFSANGVIGDGHLLYYLKDKTEEEIRKITLWSFSQRKFQTYGTMSDTFLCGHINSFLPEGPPLDAQGYAVSMTEHVTGQHYIEDNEILQTYPCVDYKRVQGLDTQMMALKLKRDLTIGYYEDGKCIILQPGARACVFTSAAMVLLDKRVDFDLKVLFRTNFENDDTLKSLLNQYGYKLQDLGNDINQLQTWLEEHGSILVGLLAGPFGRHQIVLDAIDEETVTIREPAHGWRIKIKTIKFFEMQPVCHGILPNQP